MNNSSNGSSSNGIDSIISSIDKSPNVHEDDLLKELKEIGGIAATTKSKQHLMPGRGPGAELARSSITKTTIKQ